MGKTALALNIAENAAVLGKKTVAVFSLEMSKKALLMRLLCSQANVDSHKLRPGSSEGGLSETMGGTWAPTGAKLFIDDSAAISVSEIRAKAQRLRHQQEDKLDLIVVDYLQLMSGTPIGGGRRPKTAPRKSPPSRAD